MGLIWAGTTGHGLNRFDPDTERFTHYRHDPANPRSLSNDTVVCICEDRTGTLWIGTTKGLDRFDRQNVGWVECNETQQSLETERINDNRYTNFRHHIA
jgi:ligand-binding sensor domain-containing protein